ncbi:signal transduction histidine kinase/CheY-like chemotaxis protein [Bosea sp. BE271]|uniref:response regulator n=2 Tax=Boseaceae TaxID=2831100 RepID=UPI00285F317D|nr:response regulator [Bosea sp. BE271]MDR6897317.1 signal transduction histidine kinase/CheY-like chemotaxis protein [Bosea sp. BE109]MDR7177806.1 signal transduction histidine kinase/CheY-like chemotaxis protein [Bosea sp. BE271]
MISVSTEVTTHMNDSAVAARPVSGLPSRVMALALVAVILLPGLAYAALLLSRYSMAERAGYEQDALNVAQSASSLIDRQLLGWKMALQTLATSAHLKSGDLRSFYEQAMLVKPFVNGDIGLREHDGRLVLSTAAPFGTDLPPTRIRNPPEAELGQPFVSDVFVGALVDRPLVAAVVPVSLDGSVRYHLHVSVPTVVLHDIVRQSLARDWIIGVGDRAGRYVLRSDDDASFRGKPGNPDFLAQAVGKSGTFVGNSARGESVLVGYARSDVSGWLVAANIPRTVIERPLWDAVLSLVAFGATALIVAGLGALWIWRTIERPLEAVTGAARRLGRTDEALEFPTNLREFATLRDALSSASRELKRNSDELEARVEARTRELTEANESLVAESERRARLEGMLSQAQKMEAIGNLTGGVAHDFNNLLQVIGGNLQLLARELGENDRARVRIEKAMAGVARGAHLATQLLAFGRRQPLEPRVVNAGKLIRGMDDLLRRTIGEAVDIETVVAGGLWNTMVDPTNLENAILNLAINARDAMDGRGHLTIETGNAFLDDNYAERHDEVQAGQYVQISVTDTGSGMSPEVMAKVFEPFFSTKPAGKGTGLGLSMVFGFVKQSGGHVKIYSEPGHGTTVKLYLPRSAKAEEAIVEAETGPVVGGSETVLVVEDDEAVRETVVATLGELGYRVLKASDAHSACVVIESGVEIDLLFTDVVMPGPMRSTELARRAKERLPQVSVLFTSGYTENSIVHGGRLDEGVNLLSKPYSRDALARKLRQVFLKDGKTASGVPSPLPDQKEDDVAAKTVLVCEDDALIRLDLVDMLQDMGHLVLEAADGSEALATAGLHAIDVLVTDVGLPDMRGDELARRLLERSPTLAVVFATGQSALPEFEGRPGVSILKKPFQLKGLERAFRAALESAESDTDASAVG